MAEKIDLVFGLYNIRSISAIKTDTTANFRR